MSEKPLPQINLDDFSLDTMEDVLLNYGSCEVIGPSVDLLSVYAKSALELSKQLFSLPRENLLETTSPYGLFHGYQDVHNQSLKTLKEKAEGIIINQVAFHLRPYLSPRILKGITIKEFYDYYQQALTLLQRFYNKIADHFIRPQNISVLDHDTQSLLTSRFYFKNRQGESTMSAHTDYGLLTLVVSEQPGLEIYGKGNWISAPHTPSLRFYVNLGDWLLFQINNQKYCNGLHRVVETDKDRYSLTLFMNPPYEEKQHLPSGNISSFEKYLEEQVTKNNDF